MIPIAYDSVEEIAVAWLFPDCRVANQWDCAGWDYTGILGADLRQYELSLGEVIHGSLARNCRRWSKPSS